MSGTADTELRWTRWVPLEGARRDPEIPKAPGLYRIRSVQTGRMLYVGQTGRTLRERLGALKGVYAEEMPYNDPHTAAPALWAHRIDTGETFEVSVAMLDVDKADRMGREALEVSKQRIIDGCSPAYNFGRMPFGWIKSTGNNRRLVEAGKRARGRRMTDEELAALPPDPSVPPPPSLEGDPRAADWLGLAWRPSDTAPPARTDTGVYRISMRRDGPLDYVGQGLIVDRWKQHTENWFLDLAAEAGARDVAAGDVATGDVWDWVGLALSSRQLLEVENDLIAGHMVTFTRPPRVQFGNGPSARAAG